MIISIGLREDIGREISRLWQAHRSMPSFNDAHEEVSAREIGTILIGSGASPTLKEDVRRLLGNTSLTTRIVLFTMPGELINSEFYEALGVRVVNLPASAAEAIRTIRGLLDGTA